MTKNKVQYSKATGILVILVAFFLFSCSNKGADIQEIVTLDSTVSVEKAENVEFSYTDSGYLKVILKAPKTSRYHYKDNPYTEMVEGIDAKFYNDDLEVESTLKSDYAKSWDKKKLVEVRNNVVVTNVKNEKLETEKLTWNQITEKIYTDKYVTITTDKQIITGTGLRANQNFTKWTLLKPSGTFNIEDDKQVDTSNRVDAAGSSIGN